MLTPFIGGAFWLLLSCLSLAHAASYDDWAKVQKQQIEALSAENRSALKSAEDALAQAQEAQSLAQELADSEAEKIALEAVQIARDTRDRLLAAQRRIAFRLSAVEKVERQLLDARPRTNIGITSIQKGDVRIRTANGWKPLDEKTIIKEGDEISAGQDGFIELMFTDGAKVNLHANSSFRAAELGKEKTILDNLEGVAHMVYHCLKADSIYACNNRSLMRTPTAVAAVRGTEYQIMTHPDRSTELIVIKGEVEFKPINEGEPVIVRAGQRARISEEGVVSPVEKIDVKSLERWWDIAP